jgi:ABC-2 type transport system permease protein
VLTFPIVITVAYLGSPDLGAIFTGYLGSLLLAGAYLSVALATSALTRNQVVSFILSVVICFFLILAGWEPVTNLLVRWAPQWFVETVASFSVMPHFSNLQRGVVDLRDLIFFGSVIGFCLFSNSLILRNLRGA